MDIRNDLEAKRVRQGRPVTPSTLFRPFGCMGLLYRFVFCGVSGRDASSLSPARQRGQTGSMDVADAIRHLPSYVGLLCTSAILPPYFPCGDISEAMTRPDTPPVPKSAAVAAPASLYVGEVMHRRSRPKAYKFVYRIFNMVLDIDRLAEPPARCRLFSHNRFNLFSFHDRDHGPRDGSALRPWIEEQLAAAGLRHAGADIRLLCMPRVLGYGFDPLSIWYCHDAGGELRAVLYQVKNTFGDQHGYLLPVGSNNENPTAPSDHEFDKIFHVSPLIAMDARYRIRTSSPDETLAVLIRESDDEGEFLVATLTGDRRAMTDGALIRQFLRVPFMSLKVIVTIHWQAIRLILRGAKYTKRPEPPAEGVSMPPQPMRKDAA